MSPEVRSSIIAGRLVLHAQPIIELPSGRVASTSWRDTADRHIVQGLVGIARALGLTSVAEGVEDLETLELLRDLDVDQAQGYYIGRAAPIDATET